MLASLLLDGTGALGVEREPIDVAAATGAAAVLAGVVLIVRAQGGARRGAALDRRSRSPPAPRCRFRARSTPACAPISTRRSPPAHGASWSRPRRCSSCSRWRRAGRARALDQLDRVPWWGWLGGLCGATYVTSVFLLIPEIGVAPTIALTVAGQQVASVFVDRHGLLRLPRRPITARARRSGS